MIALIARATAAHSRPADRTDIDGARHHLPLLQDQLQGRQGPVEAAAWPGPLRRLPARVPGTRLPGPHPRRTEAARRRPAGAGAATQPPADDLKTAFFLPETMMVGPQEFRDSGPFAAAPTPMDDEDASIVGTTDLDLLALESGLPQAPHDADFDPTPFEVRRVAGHRRRTRARDPWGAPPLPVAGPTPRHRPQTAAQCRSRGGRASRDRRRTRRAAGGFERRRGGDIGRVRRVISGPDTRPSPTQADARHGVDARRGRRRRSAARAGVRRPRRGRVDRRDDTG